MRGAVCDVVEDGGSLQEAVSVTWWDSNKGF